MRIGIVYLGRRGAGGILALDAARYLASYADPFAVVSHQAEHYDQWKQSGLEHVAVNTFQNNLAALLSLIDDRSVRSLAKIIRSRQPDVLLFPMLHPWNPGLQALLAPVPSVVMVHDAVPHPGWIDRFYSVLEGKSIRRAHQVIVFSQAMLPAVRKRGAKQERTAVIPLPAFDYYHRFDVAHPIAKEPARKLLFFGRIAPYKGLEVLLQAYTLLDPACRLPLVIAGEGNLDSFQKILAALPDVRVENRWIADEEVPDFFTPGTILVLPYTSASQSGVVEIAASYGLPVIATRVGGIPEQVSHGFSGLLIDPGHAEQLKNAICQLTTDPGLADQLGQHLHGDSQAKRGWQTTAENIYRVLSLAVNRKQA